MASSVEACAATGRPALVASSTRARSSSRLKVGVGRVAGAAAVVGVDLDPVGARGDLVAHGDAHAVHPVGLLGALGHVPARVEARRAVAARGDDGARRGQHARSLDQAQIDRVAQGDVGEAGALGAEVTDRREAGFERRARGHDAPDGAQLERLLEHLVVPRRLVVGVQQQVRVQVDQPRDEVLVVEREPARRGGHGDLPRRCDRLDASAAHEHDAVLEPAAPVRSQHVGPREQQRLPRFGRSLDGRGDGEREREEQHGLGPPRAG